MMVSDERPRGGQPPVVVVVMVVGGVAVEHPPCSLITSSKPHRLPRVVERAEVALDAARLAHADLNVVLGGEAGVVVEAMAAFAL
jgi:hypothetical protein